MESELCKSEYPKLQVSPDFVFLLHLHHDLKRTYFYYGPDGVGFRAIKFTAKCLRCGRPFHFKNLQTNPSEESRWYGEASDLDLLERVCGHRVESSVSAGDKRR